MEESFENPKEVCPPEVVPDNESSCPHEMGGVVHFFEKPSAEVAPLGIKLPLSKLHLSKKPVEPPSQEAK
ncbi:MAG: hypothetical protein M0Q93_00175 [Terrimicrobiaceae bacterium]|jgi:hypothetical protein|nr:hypothetical protein [Terrimicrobiaceae bacterium]